MKSQVSPATARAVLIAEWRDRLGPNGLVAELRSVFDGRDHVDSQASPGDSEEVDRLGKIDEILSKLRASEVGHIRQALFAPTPQVDDYQGESTRQARASYILCNCTALTASCGAAIAFQRLAGQGDARSVIKRLWATQKCFDPDWQADVPADIDINDDQITLAKFAQSLPSLPAAATYWMEWWFRDQQWRLRLASNVRRDRTSTGDEPKLGKGALTTMSVSVPIVAVLGGTKGCVYDLHLEAVKGAGRRLFPHPESALISADPDWLRTLEVAGGFLPASHQTEKLLNEKGDRMGPVCWRISRLQTFDEDGNTRSLSGKSHGGAVAMAFWHLALKKIPDPGVFILAELKEPSNLYETAWDTEPQEWHLKGVGNIREKVAAAAEEESVDTIIVCGPAEIVNQLARKYRRVRSFVAIPEATQS